MYKPVHFLLIFLSFFLIEILPAQQAWVKHVDVEKGFTTGGYIFSFVRHMDKKNSTKSLAQYGYFDRTKQYNVYGKQILQTSTDSNSVKRVNGVLQSAGKMNFTSSHSVIYAHDTILGKEYIGVGKVDSIGTFYAAFNVLNTATNKYERVANLTFDSPVKGFVYLGNNKVLIFGTFYEASDGVTKQVYEGVTVWDMFTNTLSLMPGGGIGSSYFSHSTGIDGTTAILVQSGSLVRFAKQGPVQWSEGLFPGVTIGGRIISIDVVNQDTAYAAWQKDSIGYPCYLLKFIRSQGISWQQCARLTSTKTTVDVRNTWVNSIDYLNGKLRISTEATHCNGQLLGNNVFDLDPSTGVITNLPIPPIAGKDFGTSRMTVVDGKTYLLSDLDLVLGTQTIYVLRDTTARLAPVITSPTGTQLSSGVTVAGTVPEPLLSIDVYNKGTGLKMGSTVASSTGTWTLQLSLAEGIYSFQAKARNEDSIVSPFSNTLTFSVSFPTAVADITNDENSISIFPNPVKNSFTVKNGKEILRIVSLSGVVQHAYKVSKTTEAITVSFSSINPGIYFVELKGKDGKTYTKKIIF